MASCGTEWSGAADSHVLSKKSSQVGKDQAALSDRARSGLTIAELQVSILQGQDVLSRGSGTFWTELLSGIARDGDGKG